MEPACPRAPRRQARAFCQAGSVPRRATPRRGCRLSGPWRLRGPDHSCSEGATVARGHPVQSLQGVPLSQHKRPRGVGRHAHPAPPHHAACSRVLGTAPVPRKWPSAVLGRPPRGLPGSGGTVGHVSRPSVAVQGSGGWGADPEPPGSEPSAPRAGQSPRGQPRAGSSANGPRCRTTPRRGCNHSRPRGGGWAPARQWRPERWWEGQLRAAPRLADHWERQEVLARG